MSRPVKPLPFIASLPYFIIPALAFILSIYWLMPALMSAGMTEFVAYLLALTLPLVFMLAASLIALRMEGWPLTWTSIQERFRLRPMAGRDWLWTGLALLAMIVGAGIFGAFGQILVINGAIPLPAHLPSLLDPLVDPAKIMDTFAATMGPNAKGNWGLVALSLTMLFFNIIGEEFWWRGLILPRQELAHGKYTWLIHGTMWALFHAFKYWQWIGLWPVTLVISFVAQKRQNTWPGIVTHFIFNAVSLIPILFAVLGK